jgi:putative endonuclease
MSHRPTPQAAPDPLTQALFAAASAAQRSAVRKRARRLAKSGQTARTESNRDTPRRSPRQKLGDAGEDRALELLQAAGCRLLGRQLRCPLGELDLVMRDGAELVFVEVRTRSSTRFGSAAESIGVSKQRRLMRAARWWLRALTRAHFDGKIPPCRFDVVTIDASTLFWHRDAMRPSPD